MCLIRSLILKNLDELKQDDFERFKTSLTGTIVEGFELIPCSKLEKANQINVVDLMVSQYGPAETVDITVKVLRDIGQNHLAMDLEEKLKEKVQTGGVDSESSSSSSSSSQAAGVSMTISADGASNIQAPFFSGVNCHGPVTMNFNSPK
ncbi:apoptosis-associated speck-like protein containing a CARD isoform 2-T3 [Clarias gariepinus]